MSNAGLPALALRRIAKQQAASRSMNLDYVSIGRSPPEEVNAIIEVPIGGSQGTKQG
jgi:hypothetical protein